jgi:hypothetical protein
VVDVGKEGFAITLWTFAELMAMDSDASVERLGERTDMAGLMAVAFHQPSDLQKAETRYLKAAGQLSQMMDATRDRLTKLATDMARAVPRPEE